MTQNTPPTPNERHEEPVLDVRGSVDFERRHRAGAVNIPLEELAHRLHELPPRSVPVTIYDTDGTRARWARSRLRARNRLVADVLHGEDWLHAGPIATGPSRGRLWRPHPLLVEAVNRARRCWPAIEGHHALDIACGAGRDAVFLALSGLATEAWDVLPDAIALCDQLASRHGVCVKTRRCDLEADPAIPGTRYDLVCCFNFLHRPLMRHLADAVRPGGFVVYETFVHPQRDLFGKPRRDARILKPRELPTWFQGWEILASHEGLAAPRRFAASLIARKPVAEKRPPGSTG